MGKLLILDRALRLRMVARPPGLRGHLCYSWPNSKPKCDSGARQKTPPSEDGGAIEALLREKRLGVYEDGWIAELIRRHAHKFYQAISRIERGTCVALIEYVCVDTGSRGVFVLEPCARVGCGEGRRRQCRGRGQSSRIVDIRLYAGGNLGEWNSPTRDIDRVTVGDDEAIDCHELRLEIPAWSGFNVGELARKDNDRVGTSAEVDVQSDKRVGGVLG